MITTELLRTFIALLREEHRKNGGKPITTIIHGTLIEDLASMADEIERLRAQWTEARRGLNEFRPIGDPDWVAVRTAALGFVIDRIEPPYSPTDSIDVDR